MINVGDILSTVGGVQYRGGKKCTVRPWGEHDSRNHETLPSFEYSTKPQKTQETFSTEAQPRFAIKSVSISRYTGCFNKM